jgi:polysaccharide biosynthesis protein PelG
VAGIGFSLRALSNRPGYTGMLRLYGAAALVSSGPWLLSVTGLLLIGLLGRRLAADPHQIERFQVSVTWLLAASLVVSGPLQLQLTRFVADQVYLRRFERITPNLFGAMLVMSGISLVVAGVAAPWFQGESLGFQVLLGIGFVTLSNVWIVTCVLTGLRRHWPVLRSFAIGYFVMLVLGVLLSRYGEVGLLAAFVAGQASLLVVGARAITDELGCEAPFEWACLRRDVLRPELLLAGLFFNLGIWADKLVFWFHPASSRPVAGFFRASDVYDLPIFLAYLTLVPGMAVFLVRVETDFAERHAAFYAAIRGGAPLGRIEPLLDSMVDAVRRALVDIGRTQLVSLLLCLWAGPALLAAFGISRLHLPLFYVDVVGVLLQVLLLTLISVFFYLDRCRLVAKLSLLFLSTNVAATWLSYELGPRYYGWGFVLAAGLTAAVALASLNRTLRFLVRDTFMLQPVGR